MYIVRITDDKTSAHSRQNRDQVNYSSSHIHKKKHSCLLEEEKRWRECRGHGRKREGEEDINDVHGAMLFRYT